MTRRKPTKPELHRHLEQSRKAQAPSVGDRVFYPHPFPPVSHVKQDGKTVEIAVPTGDEQWFPATVVVVEHHEHIVSPNDYVAALEPESGLPLSLSVVFLRAEKSR